MRTVVEAENGFDDRGKLRRNPDRPRRDVGRVGIGGSVAKLDAKSAGDRRGGAGEDDAASGDAGGVDLEVVRGGEGLDGGEVGGVGAVGFGEFLAGGIAALRDGEGAEGLDLPFIERGSRADQDGDADRCPGIDGGHGGLVLQLEGEPRGEDHSPLGDFESDSSEVDHALAPTSLPASPFLVEPLEVEPSAVSSFDPIGLPRPVQGSQPRPAL